MEIDFLEDVARVDQRPSITRDPKRRFHESLSQRDLKNLLERETFLSDAPLNYYRYLLLEMDEDLCAEDMATVRSWIFPTHFMTYLERDRRNSCKNTIPEYQVSAYHLRISASDWCTKL